MRESQFTPEQVGRNTEKRQHIFPKEIAVLLSLGIPLGIAAHELYEVEKPLLELSAYVREARNISGIPWIENKIDLSEIKLRQEGVWIYTYADSLSLTDVGGPEEEIWSDEYSIDTHLINQFQNAGFPNARRAHRGRAGAPNSYILSTIQDEGMNLLPGLKIACLRPSPNGFRDMIEDEETVEQLRYSLIHPWKGKEVAKKLVERFNEIKDRDSKIFLEALETLENMQFDGIFIYLPHPVLRGLNVHVWSTDENPKHLGVISTNDPVVWFVGNAMIGATIDGARDALNMFKSTSNPQNVSVIPSKNIRRQELDGTIHYNRSTHNKKANQTSNLIMISGFSLAEREANAQRVV